MPTPVSNKKTIGVLGGMGPQATVLFFQKVVELTPARSDQEHIPLVIYNQPLIPDRTNAILGHGESPLPALIAGIELLQSTGVDFICIPCNTAHHYFSQLVKRAAVPIVSLIDTLVHQVLSIPRLTRVGLLATRGAITARIYQDAFLPHNVEVVTPEEWELNDLHSIIGRLKGGDKSAYAIQKMAEGLAARKIQGLILGCTELSLVVSDLQLPVPIIDSTEVLARRVVRIALGQEDL